VEDDIWARSRLEVGCEYKHPLGFGIVQNQWQLEKGRCCEERRVNLL